MDYSQKDYDRLQSTVKQLDLSESDVNALVICETRRIKMGKILAKVENGKKKVRISDDGYGLELYTMKNGFQWTGTGVDDELLKMIQLTITKYFESI